MGLLFILFGLVWVRYWMDGVAENRMKMSQQTELSGKYWGLVGRMSWRLGLVFGIPFVLVYNNNSMSVDILTWFMLLELQVLLYGLHVLHKRKKELLK